MPIIPTGRPVWERSVDHTSYGGNVEKRNHLGQGAIDALTDVSAEEYSRLVADLAAVARTAPFLTLTYICRDTPSNAPPTILSATGMMGRRLTSYEGDAAPAGFPSAARNGSGDVTFTFASSYVDPYGVSGQFVVSHPRAASTSTGVCNCDVLSPTTLRVRAFQFLGSAVALLNATVTLTLHSGG